MAKVNNRHHGEDDLILDARATREAFERGTEAFNVHDLKGFREVRADDVIFKAPGGLGGEGKAACVELFSSWFIAFRDAHVDVHDVHILENVAVEEGTFTGGHGGVLSGPVGDVAPTRHPIRIPYIRGAPLPGWQARLLQLDLPTGSSIDSRWSSNLASSLDHPPPPICERFANFRLSL